MKNDDDMVVVGDPSAPPLVSAENGHEPELPEVNSLYGDAPKLYWKIAGMALGWRAEVAFWVLLVLFGFLLALIVGIVLATITVVAL